VPTAIAHDHVFLALSTERHVLTFPLASTSYRLLRHVPLTIMAAKGAVESGNSPHQGSQWPLLG
jgi:hypothetical protein